MVSSDQRPCEPISDERSEAPDEAHLRAWQNDRESPLTFILRRPGVKAMYWISGMARFEREQPTRGP